MQDGREATVGHSPADQAPASGQVSHGAEPRAPESSTQLERPLTRAELTGLAITTEDVEAAVAKVQPSVRREGFATVPGTSWADVGALQEVRGGGGC